MAPQSQYDPKATYTCKHCGAWHGGSKAANVCPDCWAKGKR